VVHGGRLGSRGAIVGKGEVLAIGIFEDGGSKKGSIYCCIDFGLEFIGDGIDIKSAKLFLPDLLRLFANLVEVFPSYFLVEVHPGILDTDIG
jgi:hypothetical protein